MEEVSVGQGMCGIELELELEVSGSGMYRTGTFALENGRISGDLW